MVNSSRIAKLIESILFSLENFVKKNTCWDKSSPYYGGVIETIPHTPHPVWSHTSYQVADAYLKLYKAYGNEEYWNIAKIVVGFLVREQTEVGCWYGYTGYPKSYGWNERNAPPGSRLNVKLEDGNVLDIIRKPFSIFGTALYSKVIANALIIAKSKGEISRLIKNWSESFIKAVEFIYWMIDEKGYWVGERAWNQRAAIALTLFTASKLLGLKRYADKAKIILKQILKAQLPHGEFPYAENSGRTYHYHCLTLHLLNQIYEVYPVKRIRESVLKSLNWLWSMQKNNGDFDWSIHALSDHKTRLLSTFSLALQASAPYIHLYEDNIVKVLKLLKSYQVKDGGFPQKNRLRKV